MSLPTVKSNSTGGGDFQTTGSRYVDLEYLGKRSRSNSRHVDLNSITVRVKRQDSTVTLSRLGDEFCRFTHTQFPIFLQHRPYTFPTTFQHSRAKLRQMEGFPEKGVEMFSRQVSGAGPRDHNLQQWSQIALGEQAEEDVFNSLSQAFGKKDGASLLWNSLKTEQLFKVARESVVFEANQERKNNPTCLEVQLTASERQFFTMLDIDIPSLERDVNLLVVKLFSNCGPTATETEVLGNLTIALMEVKPIFADLPPQGQKKYRNNLRDHLIKAFQKLLSVEKTDLEAYLMRYFLEHLQRNSEFDFLAVDKGSSCVFQVETKSYPQTGIVQPGALMDSLKKANEQLGKGERCFQNLIAPCANLSPNWTWVGLVALPNISNKQQLIDDGIDDSALPFILTKEELVDKACSWKRNLTSGRALATDIEYKTLFSLLVGSHYVSFQNQIYSEAEEKEELVKETSTRISGVKLAGDVVGLGGGSSGLLGGQEEKLLGLKNRALGDVWSILFWNEAQRETLDALNQMQNLLLFGDFGGGKTSVLVEGAKQRAMHQVGPVQFFSALSLENSGEENIEDYKEDGIFDVALETRWEHSPVEVVTVQRMQKELCSKSRDVHQLIRGFLEKNGDSATLQVFIDELPLSSDDIDQIEMGEESELVKTIQLVGERSKMAWISLSTSSLLETTGLTGNVGSWGEKRAFQTDHLEKYLEEKCPGYMLQKLGLCMRNSGNISKAASQKGLQSYDLDGSTMAFVSEGGRSTVPGPKPTFLLRDWSSSDEEMYEDISRCLADFVDPTAERHTVVLCGVNISPKKLTEVILKGKHGPVTLYDGGMHLFDCDMNQSSHPLKFYWKLAKREDQRASLKKWLTGPGGVLVTHNILFCGMEAEVAILVSRNLSCEPNLRSGLLRAVANLILISGGHSFQQTPKTGLMDMFHVKFGDDWYKYKAKKDSFLDRLGLVSVHISKCEQDELKKQENDEALKRQFNEESNEVGPWIERQKDAVADSGMDMQGRLEEQLSELSDLSELSEYEEAVHQFKPHMEELEGVNQEIQESLLFENKGTPHTKETLSVEWEQLATSVKRTIEILTRESKGSIQEQLNKFRASFNRSITLHFYKYRTSRLNPEEFKNCLISLGYSVGQDKQGEIDFQRILSIVDPNTSGYVKINSFLDFITYEAPDVDTAKQVIDSFKILAADKPYILPEELRRELPPNQAQYCIQMMQPYSGIGTVQGALDYMSFPLHDENEEEMLRRAIAMSLDEQEGPASGTGLIVK